MLDKVKCVDCGYLQLRNRNSDERVGASPEYRNAGAMPRSGNYDVYDSAPLCWKGVDLSSETEGTDRTEGHAVAAKLRPCNLFTPWQPSLSPKEHHDMTIVEKVEALHARHRKEDINRQERFEFRNNLRGWVAILIAVIALVVSILS